jgi:hypothetical protein
MFAKSSEEGIFQRIIVIQYAKFYCFQMEIGTSYDFWAFVYFQSAFTFFKALSYFKALYYLSKRFH